MVRSIVILILVSLVNVADAQMLNGCVYYGKFENTPNSILKDGLTGTVNGVTYTASGRVGGCYVFGNNSTDDVTIDMPSSVYENEIITVSQWIYADSHGGLNLGRPFVLRNAITNFLFCNFYYVSPYLFRIVLETDINKGRWETPSGLVPFNKWHHIVLVFNWNTTNSNMVKMYLDGSPVYLDNYQTPEGSIPSDNSPNRIVVGNFDSNGARVWDGRIDEVMIYKLELSETQIRLLATAPYFVQENFKNDKDYEKLIDATLFRMYYDLINSADNYS